MRSSSIWHAAAKVAEVRVRQAALQDLEDIEDYSLERFGVPATAAYADRIQAALSRLGELPEMGQPARGLNDVRAVKSGSHRIFYRIEEGVVSVLRILHHAQDAARWIDG